MSKNLLCQCDDIECDQPHTELELSLMDQSDVEQAEVGDNDDGLDSSPCPKCGTPSYEYIWKDLSIAYCNICKKDWNLETGEFLLDSIIGENDIPDNHKMYMDSHELWLCKNCNFETMYMSEVTKHERENNSMTQSIKTDDGKHSYSYVQDKSGTRWNCNSCTHISKNFQEAKDHEASDGGKIELHYVRYSQEIKSQQCVYCKMKFDTWIEAEKHENAAGKKAQGYSNAGYVPTPHCVHPPAKMIEGEGGKWGVWVGRKYDCESRLNEFDIVLNLTGNSVGKRHEIPVPELSKWQSGGNRKYKEFVLNWPDRGVVDLPSEFWRDLVSYLKTNSYKMLMFCMGGHGRTGTALASMFVIACGMEPRAALDRVHELHCQQAVESLGQEKYVWSIAGKLDKFVAKFEYKSSPTYQSVGGQTQLLGGF